MGIHAKESAGVRPNGPSRRSPGRLANPIRLSLQARTTSALHEWPGSPNRRAVASICFRPVGASFSDLVQAIGRRCDSKTDPRTRITGWHL